MIINRNHVAIASFAWAWSVFISSTSLATGNDVASNPAVISSPAQAEHGQWRTRVQPVFDANTQSLVRRTYQVWDHEPAPDLDFVWIPNHPESDYGGRLTGEGRLIWRVKGRPSYDEGSVVAEYRGAMRDGRMEGRGVYLNNKGLMYDGDWKLGSMEGHGVLKLPGGDEYIGSFRAGAANGAGVYTEVTGEIFEGKFENGQKRGRGTTTLPNGHKYISFWVDGKEAAGSRLVRVAQAGGDAASSATDDVSIGITLDKRLPPVPKDGGERPTAGDLWYKISNTSEGLEIKPDDPRLLEMWKSGGEIQVTPDEQQIWIPGDGVGPLARSKSEIVPLTMELQLQNRSATAINISGIYLDVRNSARDLQPAMQLYAPMEPCASEYYRPRLYVQNFGWGAANETTIRFDFASPEQATRPTSFHKAVVLGVLEKSEAKVDLDPDFKSTGLKTVDLAANASFECKKPKTQQACLQDLKSSGIFGSIADKVGLSKDYIVVNAVGVVEYTWREANGTVHKVTSPFNAPIPLGVVFQDAECGGYYSREAVSAVPLQLKLDGSNYRIPVSFSSTIAPGSTGRLSIPVEAAESSQHEFQVVVQLSDGREIKSRNINLLYYRPSWELKQ